MILKAGQKLVSAVDATSVVVVRAGAGEVAVTCGGLDMVDAKAPGADAPKTTGDPSQMEGTQIGKRYADEDLGVELLVTKAGTGTLALNGKFLQVKGARPLPASD